MIRENSFFERGKIKRPKGPSTRSPQAYCEPNLLYNALQMLNKGIPYAFNLLKETNEDFNKNGVDAQVWYGKLEPVISKWNNILRNSNGAIYLSEEEKRQELETLLKETRKAVILPSSRDSAFSKLNRSIESIEALIKSVDEPLISTIDNVYKYYSYYVDLTPEEKSKLRASANEYCRVLKKLDNLTQITKSAFDLQSFMVLEELFAEFADILSDFYDKFEEIDAFWGGELSKVLKCGKHEGKEYIRFLFNCSNANMTKIKRVSNFNMEVPKVLAEHERSSGCMADRVTLKIQNKSK